MIASLAGPLYLRRVIFASLARWLVLLALLVAPLGMMDDHAAMATAALAAPSPAAASSSTHHEAEAAPAGHCADSAAPAADPDSVDRDCRLDCAVGCSAVPTPPSVMPASPLAAASLPPRPLVAHIHGRQPEADPPPPRTA